MVTPIEPIKIFSEYYIRKSRYEDIPGVLTLAMKCFSPWDLGDIMFGVYDERYYVAVRLSDNAIIGMSALGHSDDYVGGHEVDWTCVDPEERRKGICYELAIQVINEAKKKTKGLYWSAWKNKGSEEPDCKAVLDRLGFKLIQKDHERYITGHTCDIENAKHCPQRHGGGNVCTCSTDLYYLPLQKE